MLPASAWLLPVTVLAATGGPAVPDSTLRLVRHAEADRIANLRYESQNPVRLSHNAVTDYGYGAFGYQWQQGGFHAIDASGHADAFGIRLDGRRRLGWFDLAGFIAYGNATERDRRWNSTLFLPTDNPFILCDSVAGDAATEAFRLGFSAAWTGQGRFSAALDAEMLTGSMADQTDPRPKTDATRIRLTPGAEYRLTEALSLGLSLRADIYRSDISHAIINTQVSHRYFLMKGMGDFQRQSSTDIGSYPREYKGETFGGALQLVYEPKGGRWGNFLEIGALGGGEEAVDGGTYFCYRGGDYSRTGLSLNERTQFRGRRATHDLSLTAAYNSGEGKWYDQQRLVDTEHGNITYYEVLSKYTVYKSTYMAAMLNYRASFPGGALPRLTVEAGGGLERKEEQHYAAGTLTQQFTRTTLHAGIGKNFPLHGWELDARLHGSYAFPLGSPGFAAATAELEQAYAAPLFEYRTAAAAAVGGALQAFVPFSQKGLALHVFANVDSRFYCGHDKWSALYAGTSRLSVRAGLGLAF